MLFNSLQYGVFLLLIIAVYFLSPARFRWMILLASSYYFYMSWNPKLVVLILFTTVVSYVSALKIEEAKSKKQAKRILIFGVSLCLLCLFFFKYFNFFSLSVMELLRSLSLPVGDFTIKVMLPVGISFYTFQTLSYIVDVYRKDMEAEKHFGYYALYVSFFPQLVAGPIERATSLLPQLKTKKAFDRTLAVSGMRLICYGLFKKIVVADTVAAYVNRVYNSIHEFDSLAIVIATLFFAVQIYCDFSGYSDIAIGSARIFGIKLMTNFDSPYFACSVKDFWRRWHISLSGWFSDYVYVPLGGSRAGRPRHILNLLTIFLLSGLWHGANWTFVVWGLYHGILSAVEVFTLPITEKLSKKISGSAPHAVFTGLRVALVFALVCFSWIMFRANSISDMNYAIMQLFSGADLSFENITQSFKLMGITRLGLSLNLLSIIVVAAWDFINLKKSPLELLQKKGTFVNNAATYFFAFAVLLRIFTNSSISAADFIYFQF
ncbi:MAG: MBOAT family O-acyltransferase [Oscillospiraceae bacterium]